MTPEDFVAAYEQAKLTATFIVGNYASLEEMIVWESEIYEILEEVFEREFL